MKRSLTRAFWTILVLAVVPPTAEAQQQQRCQQVLPSDFRRIIGETGQEILYFRDPVRMLCTGGVQIEADSAVMNRATSTLEMVGRVLYRDNDRQLTADWANYLGQTDELFARGQVVLTDMTDGSVITGDDFEYRRETEERPESRMIMRGDRPHATLPPARNGDPAEDAVPVLVWARRMETRGELVFLAETDVEFERGDLRGAADAIRFDQATERIVLSGAAHVETDEYYLEGERIDALLTGDTLRDVLSERRARLVAEDLTVRGQNIRIGFLDGQPERVEAWDPALRRATGDEGDEDEESMVPSLAPPVGAQRAIAISRDFQLRADSIDARSDAGRIREVRAVGRAYGEREADSLSVNLPDAVARDWIQGDTITGYFVHADIDPSIEEVIADGVDPDAVSAEPDTANAAVGAGSGAGAEAGDGRSEGAVLERIEVVGGTSDALSLYRTEATDGGTDPSLNFMRAKRITLFMEEGEVSRVEADGPIDGLYLDPTGNRPAPAGPPPPQTRTAS